jgi:Rrf2 family transcriptional regulator, cysteine metabolism repressor
MELALAGDSERVNLHTISEKQKISYKYLESIFKSLRKSNLVRSMRGREGGYALVKNASELTMHEIVDSLEGPLESVPCIRDAGFCRDAPSCSMRDFFEELDDGVIRFLKSKNLKWFIDKSSQKRERKKK